MFTSETLAGPGGMGLRRGGTADRRRTPRVALRRPVNGQTSVLLRCLARGMPGAVSCKNLIGLINLNKPFLMESRGTPNPGGRIAPRRGRGPDSRIRLPSWQWLLIL